MEGTEGSKVVDEKVDALIKGLISQIEMTRIDEALKPRGTAGAMCFLDELEVWSTYRLDGVCPVLGKELEEFNVREDSTCDM